MINFITSKITIIALFGLTSNEREKTCEFNGWENNILEVPNIFVVEGSKRQ